jgi:glutathione S-transferase
VRLFYSPASPYVRKVMIVAHEKGIADRFEQINITVSPVGRNEDLQRHNPLGKIPCLLLDDGRSLFDSSVISAYVDGLATPRLNPDDGPARYDALTLEALADGLLDSCLLLRYETLLRPPDKYWQEWHDGQTAKVDGALNLLESRWIATLSGRVTIGVIAVACALGYLDFRFATKDWRQCRPDLAAFFSRFSERTSMHATRPTG